MSDVRSTEEGPILRSLWEKAVNLLKNKLMAGHLGAEFGVWEIRGEDPNCNLLGDHHQPALCTVESSYEAAVDYALGLSGFVLWGHGGSIVKVQVRKIGGPSPIDTQLASIRALLDSIERSV